MKNNKKFFFAVLCTCAPRPGVTGPTLAVRVDYRVTNHLNQWTSESASILRFCAKGDFGKRANGGRRRFTKR